jgi:hypothetical protein
VALLQGSADQGVREAALARVPRARAVAADAAIVKAVVMSNARGDSLVDIQRRDAEWVNDRNHPLRRQITSAPCSDRTRALVADDAAVVEAFVMDDKGALVCASRETSDYWQGDEAKWIKPVREGRDPLVEEPALDASTGTYAVQISVPVVENGRRSGAVTLTLKIRRQAR